MKKLDNFTKSLNVLKRADFTNEDDIYKMGVIGQFNLTFELAWKALQAVLRIHGVNEAATGSPREILQLGYKFGFIDDNYAWLSMLKKRNTLAHVYDDEESNEMLLLIRDKFISAFIVLEKVLYEKLGEVEGDCE